MTYKLMKKLLALTYALCFVSAARAEDDFSFDSYDSYSDGASPFYGGSDFSLDGPVEETSPLDISAVGPVYLNENTSFSDAANMDIAGVWLGMPFRDVHTLFFRARSLYSPRKKNSIIYSISRDWKFNLDYECRQQNIVAPAELDRCINSLAKRRGLLYPAELHLERASTGETIVVYFTSNATNNVAWQVVYQNDVDEMEGDAEKFADQREKKILAFWQGILDKYGAPNSGNDRWITSDNSSDPMMTAYYGKLDLTNLGLNAVDAAENAKSARENFRAKPYSF